MKALSAVLLGLGLSALVFQAQAMTADEIVEKHCKACHEAGLGGAPKLTDKDAWAPRIAKGADAMTQTVLKGKGAMPPKGTCGTCSEGDLKGAVEAMTTPLQ